MNREVKADEHVGSWCTVHIPPWYKPYTGGMRGVFLRYVGNSARVPIAHANQSIHAQTIIPFVFQEHTLTRASMPKPEFRSCSKSIRYQCIRAQTIIPFVFQEHTLMAFVPRRNMSRGPSSQDFGPTLVPP